MKTLEALLQLVPLDRLPRTGWVLRGVPAPESIAGHVLGACHLALALAPREVPALALDRVLAQILVHDAPEARSGDLPRPAAQHLPAGAKAQMEEGIAAELLEGLAPAALPAWREFQSGETREARFAKLCDRLQLGVQLVAYHRQGIGGLDEFRAGLASLDTTEFPSASEFQAQVLAALQ